MLYRLAMLAALGACGDGRMAAGSDAAPVDASEAFVRVRVTGFVEKAGMRVLFQNRDSSLSIATQTNADGEANGLVGPDGFVTLVWGPDSALTMWTYAGVQPGDELEFFDPQVTNVEVPLKSISLFADDAGAPPLTLRTSCGVQLMIFDALPVAPGLTLCSDSMDFLLERAQVYRYAHDIDVTVPIPRVDFNGDYLDYATSTVTATHVPGVRATVTQALLGQGAALEVTFADPNVNDGDLSAVLDLPLPEGSTLLTQLDPDLDLHEQHIVDWRPATTTVDLAYDEVVLAGAVEPPRYEGSSIAWTDEPGKTPGDLVRATLHWQDGEHPRTRTWVVIGPRGEKAELGLPRIPVVDLVPQVEVPLSIETFFVGEQRAWLRQHMHGRWLPEGVEWPTHGDAGRVVWREL